MQQFQMFHIEIENEISIDIYELKFLHNKINIHNLKYIILSMYPTISTLFK